MHNKFWFWTFPWFYIISYIKNCPFLSLDLISTEYFNMIKHLQHHSCWRSSQYGIQRWNQFHQQSFLCYMEVHNMHNQYNKLWRIKKHNSNCHNNIPFKNKLPLFILLASLMCRLLIENCNFKRVKSNITESWNKIVKIMHGKLSGQSCK